jgi:hypothetical protein
MVNKSTIVWHYIPSQLIDGYVIFIDTKYKGDEGTPLCLHMIVKLEIRRGELVI